MAGATSTVSAPANEQAATSTPTAAYRPHLDGLRAVAVYLVVLFHAGSKRFTGGFIGVDVFFVLSGFLVTQLLLRDLAHGSIRFGRFYARRFRRLLPAAFVALLVTAIVYTAIVDAGRSGRRARRVQGRVPVRRELVLHPPRERVLRRRHHAEPRAAVLVARDRGAVLPGVAAHARRPVPRHPARSAAPARSVLIQVVVVVGAVASAAWALSLRHTDLNRAYYGTDTRAYELLAGALLALAPALDAARAALRTLAARRDLARPRRARRARHPLAPLRPDRARHRGHADHVRAPRRDRSRRRRPREARAVEQHRDLPREGVLRHLPLALDRDPRRRPRLRTQDDRDDRHRVPPLHRARRAQLRDPRAARAHVGAPRPPPARGDRGGPHGQRRVGARDHPARRRPGSRVHEVDRDAGAAAPHADPAHARLEGRGPLLPQLLQPAGDASARS